MHNESRKLKAKPERLGRLTMHGLSLDAALRGAMQVKPPAEPKKAKRTPKPKKG